MLFWELFGVNLWSLFGVKLGMQEQAELSAETQDIALSRFRLLEPHLEQHRSSRQPREFSFGRRNFFRLLRQIASKDLRHIAP